jgi:hypothetical protein
MPVLKTDHDDVLILNLITKKKFLLMSAWSSESNCRTSEGRMVIGVTGSKVHYSDNQSTRDR